MLDQPPDGTRPHAKDPASYGVSTRQGIAAARAAKKPFCLNINVADPHKPFYAEGRRGVTVADPHVPSRVFTPEEVPVPGFLPDDPVVRKELSHYYSSVRRADDAVGEVLKALEESGEAERTVVIFLSDHGMPLPVRQDAALPPQHAHAVDRALAGRDAGRRGRRAAHDRGRRPAADAARHRRHRAPRRAWTAAASSRCSRASAQDGRDMVFKEHNENSGGHRNPMRAVRDEDAPLHLQRLVERHARDGHGDQRHEHLPPDEGAGRDAIRRSRRG